MKNLIWERERASGEQKLPDGSLSFLFLLLFSFIVLISFGLWENLFLCLDCVLHILAVEIKKRESSREEKREKEERGNQEKTIEKEKRLDERERIVFYIVGYVF